MFTGIVESVGSVVSVEQFDQRLKLRINLSGLRVEKIQIGDSVSVNGACLTVTQLTDGIGDFDVSEETVSKCLIGDWKVDDQVNLETALTLQKPLGGHLVSGHVDGVTHVLSREDSEKTTEMWMAVDRSLGKYIAIKGSATINGVSLTTNKVVDRDQVTEFQLMLVPHTLNVTTLGTLGEGDKAHLEIDLIARYLERMHQTPANHNTDMSNV